VWFGVDDGVLTSIPGTLFLSGGVFSRTATRRRSGAGRAGQGAWHNPGRIPGAPRSLRRGGRAGSLGGDHRRKKKKKKKRLGLTTSTTRRAARGPVFLGAGRGPRICAGEGRRPHPGPDHRSPQRRAKRVAEAVVGRVCRVDHQQRDDDRQWDASSRRRRTAGGGVHAGPHPARGCRWGRHRRPGRRRRIGRLAFNRRRPARRARFPAHSVAIPARPRALFKARPAPAVRPTRNAAPGWDGSSNGWREKGGTTGRAGLPGLRMPRAQRHRATAEATADQVFRGPDDRPTRFLAPTSDDELGPRARSAQRARGPAAGVPGRRFVAIHGDGTTQPGDADPRARGTDHPQAKSAARPGASAGGPQSPSGHPPGLRKNPGTRESWAGDSGARGTSPRGRVGNVHSVWVWAGLRFALAK